ncbi:hypothetical protein Nepgr_005431 [Nepenthes gracilis]|uniref:non-specific serine/threonine protein kinase n=1 Tax=Nepenthes gracilis TaxID=150966 RepID=A0AAD3S351_NEPGR|nr:hypothetical protein Nepgr_005431 [Nepenthes gracilis]
MASRPIPPNPRASCFSKSKAVFLALTISATVVILFTLAYILYHLLYSLIHRSRTNPFDSAAPFKLRKFTYKELKSATNQFSPENSIGKGGSGSVFRGILSDGKSVAVKKLDSSSLQAEREFQNELTMLVGIRSPYVVSLLGYCLENNKRLLIYEYMPNRSLQDLLFSTGTNFCMSWDRRFQIIQDVAQALEVLHNECDPPVIHGDVKPSNVLLDWDFRAKISDFGLSRIKVEGEFGVEMFSQDLGKSQELWKSQELSGNSNVGTPANEMDFAHSLQVSSPSKNSRTFHNWNSLNLSSSNPFEKFNDVKSSGSPKGKEVLPADVSGEDRKKSSYDDGPSSAEHSKDLDLSPLGSDVTGNNTKQWGKDWWWVQDGSGELCSKDYVTEWIGSQICPSASPEWREEKTRSPNLDELKDANQCQSQEFESGHAFNEGTEQRDRKIGKTKPRKMQEWWKEEHLDEMSKKGSRRKTLESKMKKKKKKSFKLPHFHLGQRLYMLKAGKFGTHDQNNRNPDAEVSFSRGWKKKRTHSMGSDMWSGDLFSRELSSTTNMRGTLCYVAPEYGGCGYLMEKTDIYSLGVLILVIISGRRPLHVLNSPMKLEKANLVSWSRQLAQAGNVLELVDERLKDAYNKEQATLCINLALACLQRMPELRPDIGDIITILRGEMDLPPLPFEFSPSPPSRLFSRSRRKQKADTE